MHPIAVLLDDKAPAELCAICNKNKGVGVHPDDRGIPDASGYYIRIICLDCDDVLCGGP